MSIGGKLERITVLKMVNGAGSSTTASVMEVKWVIKTPKGPSEAQKVPTSAARRKVNNKCQDRSLTQVLSPRRKLSHVSSVKNVDIMRVSVVLNALRRCQVSSHVILSPQTVTRDNRNS